MVLLSKLKTGAFFASAACISTLAGAEESSKYNLREGVTEVSREVLNLHNNVVWVMLVIAIIVFGVMGYSMWAHRRSRHPVAATFSHSTKAEIIWTLIPFAILIGFAFPATKLLLKQEDPSKSDLTIVVKGYQWKWKYTYPDEGIEFFSSLATSPENFTNDSDLKNDPIAAVGKVLLKGPHYGGDKQTEKNADYLLEVDHELVVPVGKKIRFLVTAEDVIHAWFMPDLAVKKDAIPGFVNEAWTRIEREGVYRGQCAELCGKDHGFMPIVVRAVSEPAYAAWVAQQQEAARLAKEEAEKAAASSWDKEKLMALGEEKYNAICAACHKPDGSGAPPMFPALKNSVIAKGPVADHLNIVVNGKAGTAMQAFGAQLSDADLAAIITYERNAWGNDTGDLVQPADVAAFKSGK